MSGAPENGTPMSGAPGSAPRSGPSSNPPRSGAPGNPPRRAAAALAPRRQLLVGLAVGLVLAVALQVYFEATWSTLYAAHPYPGHAAQYNQDPIPLNSPRAVLLMRIVLAGVAFVGGMAIREARWPTLGVSWFAFTFALAVIGTTRAGQWGSSLLPLIPMGYAWFTIPPVLVGFAAGALLRWGGGRAARLRGGRAA